MKEVVHEPSPNPPDGPEPPQPESRAGWWPEGISIVHVYPQFTYHHESRIVATPEGLRSLAGALLVAAEVGRAECATMCADGEGYAIIVERTNSTGLNYSKPPYHPEWGGSTDAEHIAELRELLAARDDADSSCGDADTSGDSGTARLLKAPSQPKSTGEEGG